MILAVDIGNYNIKTSEGKIFPSTFKKGTDANPIGEEVLEYDGQQYIMTKGTFDNTFNKSKKEYLPNLLYAIALSSEEQKFDLDLMLGVPLDNLGITENFKSDLLGKTFKYSVNEKYKEVTITNLATVGESISSFYTLDANTRKEPLMIIDIGGRTVNVSIFENNKLHDKFTVTKGMIDLYDKIVARINDDGNNFVAEQMERLIETKVITDTEKEELEFIDYIMNEIERKVNRNIYKIYYTGGGSKYLVKHLMSYVKPTGELIENPLFSNVNGNGIIANIQWGE